MGPLFLGSRVFPLDAEGKTVFPSLPAAPWVVKGRPGWGSSHERGELERMIVSPIRSVLRRPRSLFAVVLAAITTMAIAAPAAQSTKYFDSSFGGTSGTPAYGGTFSSANGGVGDVAVNDPSIATDGTSQAGWIYVVDRGNNRIQAFDVDRNFKWAIGRDVVAPRTNDQQSVRVTASGGTFTLTFNGSTTTNIAFNASAATVDNALDVLPSINGDANVTVTGGPGSTSGSVPYVVTFAGTLAAADQPQMSSDATLLSGTAVVSTLANGTASAGTGNVAVNERQALAVSAVGGTFTLTFVSPAGTSATTGALAWDVPASGGAGTTASVDNALDGLTSVSAGGGSVSTTGGPGDATGSNPYEVTFDGGPLADTDVNQITVNALGLLAAIGKQLTCAGGPATATVAYQWLANGVPLGAANGAQTDTYTVQAADAGKSLQCSVTATNSPSANAASVQVSNPATIPSLLPAPPPPTAPTGNIAAPSGTVAAGNNLTCNAGTWGGVPTAYTYQWYRNGVPIGTPVQTASTSSTYTVTAADVTAPANYQCSVRGENASGAAVKFSQNKASSPAPNPAAPVATATVTPLATVTTTSAGANAFERCTVATQCKIGAAGSLGGMLDVAQGIDVDQETGAVYVRERSPNARVQQFTSDGQFVRAFGWEVTGSGPGDTGGFETCNAAAGDVCKAGVTADNLGQGNPGQFGPFSPAVQNEGKGVAIAPPGAPNAGTLYVADPFNCRVQSFTVPVAITGTVTTGVPFGAGSVGSPTADNVLCSTSSALSRIWPADVAADSSGVVYASSTNGANGGMVKRFDTTTSQFLTQIGDGSINSVLGPGRTTALEVDPASDHLLVGRESAKTLMELDLTLTPDQVSAAHLVDTHLAGLNADALAVGAGGVPSRYFVSTSTGVSGSGVGQRVLVLDDGGVEPAAVATVLPADNPGATTVTLSGFVDPVLTTDFPTSYRWQVSKDGVTWTDVSSDQLVGGDGFTPTPANDPIVTHVTGLEPNVLYLARLRTSRAPSAGFAFSPEIVFHTDPAPPIVETRPAQHVSDASADLVGRLNAGGLPAEYWFEWGDDSYGNSAPVVPATIGDGIDTIVSERISGLEPGRVHHFRLCAQNSLSVTKVCGADRTFTTLDAAASPSASRAYEMVLSPIKPLRRGGDRGRLGVDYSRFEAGVPAMGGGAFRSHLFAGATDANAGHGFNRSTSHEVRRRQAGGIWGGEAIFNVAPLAAAANATATIQAESDDLTVSAWQLLPTIFTSGTLLAMRDVDDDGGPRSGGWYPWLDQSWVAGPFLDAIGWSGNIDGAGGRAVAQAADAVSALWRDATPADGGLAPLDLTPAQDTGHSVFRADREHDWRPTDLVNECTGSDGDATTVPSRDDNGTPSGPSGTFSIGGAATYSAGSTSIAVSFLVGGENTNDVKVGHFVSGPGIPAGARVVSIVDSANFTISLPTTAAGSFVTVTGGQDAAALLDDTLVNRPCEEGSPTDVRGAILGSRGATRLGETAAGAMSESGDRIFFLSPDPTVPIGQSACEVDDSAVGVGTACPPQLFVRQWDENGFPKVSWLSRPEDVLGIGGAHPDTLGSGVAFEGASHDGSVVYFRTDAPLLESDPNGGLDPQVAASPRSWDLYRYELGTDTNADPGAGDSANRLTRISGGPDGTADPNTNCAVAASDCGGSANGGGQVVRFISDDGNRIYFVTASQIPGADNAPPRGGGDSSAPAGNLPTPVGVDDELNTATRNLYMYDAGTGDYRFIARVPFALDLSKAAGCVSTHGRAGAVSRILQVTGITPGNANARLLNEGVNCVHGASSGDAIVFETGERLTLDDLDSDTDVYVYDSEDDRLTRLSAPPPGHAAYACVRPAYREAPEVTCNGDLGFSKSDDRSGSKERGLFGDRQWSVSQNPDGELQSVFFQSRLPLVEGDENAPDGDGNGGMDVYEWHRSGGHLELVSSGNSNDSAFYAGNSLDGKDVFFWTEQPLSAWEIDPADGDVYNATTRSDLRPDPVSPPPTCTVLVGSCQVGRGVLTSTPIVTGSGGGDTGSTARGRTVTFGALSQRVRRRAARTGVLPVRIRAASHGVVRLQALAQMSGKESTVARASRKFSSAGTAIVRLRLNAKARSYMRQGHALVVDLVARPSFGHAKTLKVTLRRGGRR